MGKPVRRRLSPEARKLEIIEAAERLLQARGEHVRVEDVVREAGAAKGTFFLYFPTWDDLLEAIRLRMVAAFDQANPMPTEVDGPFDWLKVVEDQAAAFIDFAASRHTLGGAVFHADFAERKPLADNGVMRLTAVIRALAALREPCLVTLTTDSKYVCDAVTKGWVYGWQRKGWRKADGKPALNVDLWQQLLPLLQTHTVTFNWVKGHAGHPENERADALANRGIDELEETG